MRCIEVPGDCVCAQSNLMGLGLTNANHAVSGTAIGFCMEENRMRFEINLESAEKTKLKISAKLPGQAKAEISVLERHLK